MTRTRSLFLAWTVVMAAAATAYAQTGFGPLGFQPMGMPSRQTTPQENLRHQIYLMEGMLARAVTSGAARLNQQFRTVMPDLVIMAGEANARGFQLEHYGVFFDVEVPVLRQSMMWSLRTILEQDDQGASDALAALRTLVASSDRGPQRAAAEGALRRLEAQLRPFTLRRGSQAPQQGVQAATADAPDAPAAARPKVDPLLVQDPNKAYTDSVVRALIEAMVDNALPMVSFLEPEAYLTVAARDNERRDLLAPPNPFEQVSTFTLRIKAADLASYRAGKIDRDEAMKRVVVQEF
jgi:hypothetical protein